MKQKKNSLFFKAHFLVTSGSLRRTSRVCLSLSQVSPIGHQNKKLNKVRPLASFHSQAWLVNFLIKQSPTVSLFLLASSIGDLCNKTKSLLALFSLQQENKSYANTAVFISVQTGQNWHESFSTFYKSHPHPQECFVSSLHMQNTFWPILNSTVSHYFHCKNYSFWIRIYETI